jgi:AraC family transcriptional regulator
METQRNEARCAAMAAIYFHQMSDAWHAAPSGEFDILVPGGRSDAVVLSLQRDFFNRKAAEELGTEAPFPGTRWTMADPLMLGIGTALCAEWRAERVPSTTLLESFAVAIAIHLARNPRGAGGARNSAGLPPRKLEHVRSFIDAHLAEPLLVEQLAAVVHMSPFHFARLFKLATGTSPHAYVTTQRVGRAKELLRSSSLALVEVAAAVGFQTQGHFTEVFHRFAGITPRRFRLMGANGRNAAYGRKDAEEFREARI